MWQTFNTEKYYMTSRHGKSPKKKKLTAFWHSSTHLVVALVAICTNSMGMGAWAFNHQSEVQRYGTICNTILLWLLSLLYDSNCWKILHLFLHLLLSSFYTLRGSIIIGHSDYLWQKNGERQSRKNNRPTLRPNDQKHKKWSRRTKKRVQSDDTQGPLTFALRPHYTWTVPMKYYALPLPSNMKWNHLKIFYAHFIKDSSIDHIISIRTDCDGVVKCQRNCVHPYFYVTTRVIMVMAMASAACVGSGKWWWCEIAWMCQFNLVNAIVYSIHFTDFITITMAA